MVRNRQSGFSLIYAVIIVIVLSAFLSLAVDFGHVQIAKAELRAATDAAARYGAAGINNNTAVANAIAAAADNTVDGSPLVLTNSDVVLGTWNNGTFTPGGANPNAIQINSQRSASRGTAVQMLFARWLGQNSCDIHARATATAAVKGNYGMVGLQYINMKGNSTSGYYADGSGPANSPANIASNGDIHLGGNTSVNGNANPGPGYTVDYPAKVTGSTTPLTSPMSFPYGNAGGYATTNDNGNIPPNYLSKKGDFVVGNNQNLSLPGGNYYLDNVNLRAGGILTFTGPTTIYCYGNLTIGGQAYTAGNMPGNLTIVMCNDQSGNPPGWVWITGGEPLYANVYAPQSQYFSDGSGAIYGSIIALSIDMTGTSDVYFDLTSLPKTALALVQ